MTHVAPVAIRGVPITRASLHRAVRIAVRLAVVAFIGLGAVLFLRNTATLSRAVAALSGADPTWLMITALCAAGTYVGAALALRAASGRELPLGRTTVAQLAAACANRIAPAGLGAMATNLRFLEREGASRSEAVAAIGLTSVSSFVIHALLISSVIAAAGLPIDAGALLPARVPLILAALVLIGIALIVMRHRDLTRAHDALRHALTTIHALASSPRRLVLLTLGTAAVTIGHALAFVTAASALGVHAPFLTLVAVFLTGSALAAGVPAPGGLGPLEGALAAGLTGAAVGLAPAVATVLVFRLVTYWFPILPGAVALHTLRLTHSRDCERRPVEEA